MGRLLAIGEDLCGVVHGAIDSTVDGLRCVAGSVAGRILQLINRCGGQWRLRGEHTLLFRLIRLAEHTGDLRAFIRDGHAAGIIGRAAEFAFGSFNNGGFRAAVARVAIDIGEP